ncbi:MAG: hypothetical protein ABW061_22470, partial [Polyangiaceae bacterium]
EVRSFNRNEPGWNAPPKVEEPENVWLPATIQGTRGELRIAPAGTDVLELSDKLVSALVRSVDADEMFKALEAGRQVFCMALVSVDGTRVLEVADAFIETHTTEASSTRIVVQAPTVTE